MTGSEMKERLAKVSPKHYIVLLILFIFGIFLIFISKYFNNETAHHICRDVGIAFLPLSVIGFIYEYVLRDSFIKEMKLHVGEGLEATMPNSLKHLRNSGIVDAYERLDVHNLSEHIRNSNNIEIRILDILFEKLHHFKEDILTAIIDRGCSIRIMLWDMKNTDVLERRSLSLGNGQKVSIAMNQLLDNLNMITSMMERLENSKNGNLTNKIQLKLYCGFIGISLFGIGPDYYLGFYLRNYYSSDRTQLKISAGNRFFYNQLVDHFETQWLDKTNKEFKREHLDEYSNFVLSVIANGK